MSYPNTCGAMLTGEYTVLDSGDLVDSVADHVHMGVCDNASNMQGGWLDFHNIGCAPHTGQLSVGKFLANPGVDTTQFVELKRWCFLSLCWYVCLRFYHRVE